jgi:saccharopine dehydrogenase-like NADP-dependent oxidoreductase
MKKILIFGAGRSAWFTINYLAKNSHKGWELTVADAMPETIESLSKDFPGISLIVADVHDVTVRQNLVKAHNIVISLLPARFHNLVAQDCVLFKSHLITPSYITPEIKELDAEVKQNGLIFLNELGLDPGIDHMSAMLIIDRLKTEGAVISSFQSFTGGLVAADSDNNPWHYKISWNPYNIIRAGTDGGICISNGNFKYLPYNRLFSEARLIDAGGVEYDAYLNRNSLPYIALYGLEGINTFLRGTLRYKGFCRLWQFLVNAGITNDKISIPALGSLSWQDFFKIFMPFPDKELEDNFRQLTGSQPTAEETLAIKWLGFESGTLVPLAEGTPAEALQKLLEDKWKMEPQDKDRVVMLHEFIYSLHGKQYKLQSLLDLSGEDIHKTAMAKTVGLPLALAAELIANGQIHAEGVLLPVIPEVYKPLMAALERMGICFTETGEML